MRWGHSFVTVSCLAGWSDYCLHVVSPAKVLLSWICDQKQQVFAEFSLPPLGFPSWAPLSPSLGCLRPKDIWRAHPWVHLLSPGLKLDCNLLWIVSSRIFLLVLYMMHRVFSCVSGNRKKCISSMILEAKQRFYGCFIMPISSKPFIRFLQIHWVSTFCLICFIFSICRCAFLVLNYAWVSWRYFDLLLKMLQCLFPILLQKPQGIFQDQKNNMDTMLEFNLNLY